MTSRKRILAHPAVELLYQENPNRDFDEYDGDYWVELTKGWWSPCMEGHGLHEPTLKEVWKMLKNVARCDEEGGCPCNCKVSR
tara:strand:- start:801 stop:1049 length:249 start_codon:yes stop_codon:yes gene_type:complete